MPAVSLVRAHVPSVPARVSKGPNGPASKRLAIGFIGAGNYASSMLLPHLAQLPNAQLTFAFVQKLVALRRAHVALAFGDYSEMWRPNGSATVNWTQASVMTL